VPKVFFRSPLAYLALFVYLQGCGVLYHFSEDETLIGGDEPPSTRVDQPIAERNAQKPIFDLVVTAPLLFENLGASFDDAPELAKTYSADGIARYQNSRAIPDIALKVQAIEALDAIENFSIMDATQPLRTAGGENRKGPFLLRVALVGYYELSQAESGKAEPIPALKSMLNIAMGIPSVVTAIPLLGCAMPVLITVPSGYEREQSRGFADIEFVLTDLSSARIVSAFHKRGHFSSEKRSIGEENGLGFKSIYRVKSGLNQAKRAALALGSKEVYDQLCDYVSDKSEK